MRGEMVVLEAKMHFLMPMKAQQCTDVNGLTGEKLERHGVSNLAPGVIEHMANTVDTLKPQEGRGTCAIKEQIRVV